MEGPANGQVEPSERSATNPKGEDAMLYYALVFLIVAIIAGVLGFWVIAATAAGIAKILFYIFIILFIISLIMHFARRGTSV